MKGGLFQGNEQERTTVTGSQRTHSSTEEDKTMGRILRERKPKSSSLGVVHPGNGHAIVKKVGKSKPVGQTKLVKKTEGGNGLLEMKHQEYAELEAITEMKKEVSRPTDLTVKKEKKVKQQKSNPGKGVSQKSSTHTGPSDCENKCSGEIQSLEGNEETLMFVGAHCSIAGGVSNAVKEAKSLGAKAFGLFVRNGRTWKLNALNESESERFKAACKEHGYSPHLILPHGSYLLNCGSSNPDTLKKSRDTLVHELQICEKLGLTLYNFHPGSACGQGTVDQCIDTIGKSINLAHSKTKFVKTVIENMSCQGQTVGGRFEELKAIIDRVKDKTRVGVCLDTCHAFAAGFDLSSEEGYTKMMNDFEEKIGLKYLSAAHLNDSKGELGCHLDRHENIGKGRIGMDGFRRVMNDPRFRNIPMILETPVGDYAKEIQTLYQLTK
ncbi:probable endonuclease 4 isoform X2 [Aplysia californica]|uniref:Probable endonuclease 4 isoform X2 n=1 Tax=Aplysia californica TaxID=6500 RepID=A0ABM1A310_APLCA|nr:probable endonuclease 4 isoform X2 [Aplysia californica]XP_012939813.1 probable endonuclease 4 isoform X2 [Aplysia californica]